jgi:hypothetical protein
MGAPRLAPAAEACGRYTDREGCHGHTARASAALFSPLPQGVSVGYLGRQNAASARTVANCRDTLRHLFAFLRTTSKKEPASRQRADLDAPAILRFLDNRDQERHNQPQSRNARLMAIRSLVRVVALRARASVGVTTRVLAIALTRTSKRLV